MTRPDYRHPKHDAIAEMIRDDFTNKAVADELHVDPRAVARVRALIGLSRPHGGTVSRLAKVTGNLVRHEGGHTSWTGPRSSSGAPKIRHNGFEIPPSHVVFQDRYGREPVGVVKATCDYPPCLTAEHLGDELTRRNERVLERILNGLEPQPWKLCPKDVHPWETDGRIGPDLRPYCKGCNTVRAARRRTATRVAKREEDES